MPEDLVEIKKESHEYEGMVDSNEGYPYGTCLTFSDDMIEQLGIEQLAVGDVVEVRGLAFVKSKSEYSTTDDSDKSIGIQLTNVKVNRKQGDRIEQMYGPKS